MTSGFPMQAKVYSGLLKDVDAGGRHGFLTCPDADKDVYVPGSVLQKGGLTDQMLQCVVAFTAFTDANGHHRATSVRLSRETWLMMNMKKIKQPDLYRELAQKRAMRQKRLRDGFERKISELIAKRQKR